MRGPDITSGRDAPWRLPPEVAQLRVAMLGAGKMARVHLDVLRSISGVSVVGLCNRTKATGEKLASEYEIERWFPSADQMLEEAKPDAVIIAVGHASTTEMASLVLAAGIPCLIEKPAGYSAAETQQLVELAAEKNCLNVVGLNRRYYSTIQQALLEVIHQGPITGILVEAHEAIADYRSRQTFEPWLYDNWVVANTIHAIDLLRMIGGELSEVSGFRQSRAEPRGDNFSTSMRFESGMVGTFVSHWNSARGFGLKIFGQGVTAELFPLEEGFISFDTGRRIKLTPTWSDLAFKPGIYAQDTAFLQALCDRRVAPAYPASDLKDHLKTMRLLEQIAPAESATGLSSVPSHHA
jgi:predicted dehydrogenase